MRKGTTLIWLGPGNAEGGWGFNSAHDVSPETWGQIEKARVHITNLLFYPLCRLEEFYHRNFINHSSAETADEGPVS